MLLRLQAKNPSKPATPAALKFYDMGSYFLSKDKNKDKATLFVRVQDPVRKIDVQFTSHLQVNVAVREI